MVDVRLNYRNRYGDTSCPNCKAAPDDQPHLLECSLLVDTTALASSTIQYENLFKSDLQEAVRVSRLLYTNFKKRKQLLKS